MSAIPQTQPIVSLSPFMGNRWWIKARVSDKSPIRTWNKPNSSGQLFSVTLVDETSAIRATFFNEAVDMFNNTIVKDKVYYFSGGSCKAANKKFNNVNCEYELTFDGKSSVQACNEDVSAIPLQRYNFVPISFLAKKEVGSFADVLAVVTEVKDTEKIVQKSTGNELTKRTVKIADTTAAVEVTFWNDSAMGWNQPVGSIVAITSCKVGSWDGVSLSTSQGSAITPGNQLNLPDVANLAKWYSTTNGADAVSLTVKGARQAVTFESKGRKMFDDIEREGLGKGEKPDYIEVRCIPTHIRVENLFYDACPKCNRKIQPNMDGTGFRCENCDLNTPTANVRYLASMMVSDNVSQMWLTMFDDAGKMFFGLEAAALKQQIESDPSSITRLAQSKMHVPIIASIRVKEERFGDNPQERMKLTLTKCDFFTQDSEKLTKEIDTLIANCQIYE